MAHAGSEEERATEALCNGYGSHPDHRTIALGGIATGIGAIWTGVLARRQLGEQRRFLLDNTFPEDDDEVGVESLNGAALRVCGFFEYLAHLQGIEALPTETVWNSFGSLVRSYWPLCRPAIEKDREEWGSRRCTKSSSISEAC